MMRFTTFFLVPALLLLGACHQQELLKSLTEQQANEVVALLQARNLDVHKEDFGKAGYTVSVEKIDFPAAVDLVHQYSLPSQPRVQIAQAFPADTLVASPQAEQARLLSAVEQRLEQNLGVLQNVVTAHVQIGYPLLTSDSGKVDRPMHVAVLLTYRNDVNEYMLISDVKRFVKNSFENIDYGDISVIVSRAPSLFRNAPTGPLSRPKPTWFYLVAASASVLALSAVAILVYMRRRNTVKHDIPHDVEIRPDTDHRPPTSGEDDSAHMNLREVRR